MRPQAASDFVHIYIYIYIYLSLTHDFFLRISGATCGWAFLSVFTIYHCFLAIDPWNFFLYAAYSDRFNRSKQQGRDWVTLHHTSNPIQLPVAPCDAIARLARPGFQVRNPQDYNHHCDL